MTRRFALSLVAIALCSLSFNAMAADDPKEVKLVGKVTCAKCDLGKETSCQTVIVVKEKDKEVVYYFDKDGHKKFHGDTCTAPKEGTVKGTVKKEGDKMVVTVKELEYKK
ncbi:hypothetical protein KIH39_12390 [Telmatocola sphagniphila]|jgi:hypothetical protein|uniref:Uncharacterized protein n=1 Tax=Telmatocola sphagniphila TaxID=1123043 RepID=A0A8E6BB42_9BACT|nr:DUF6370 family protein [Telmatocola sphagniphila]QVL34667.1 hypothetical protein KIH39_12390 [Telmatocola sphagniphila]